jgi:hypothetical protein
VFVVPLGGRPFWEGLGFCGSGVSGGLFCSRLDLDGSGVDGGSGVVVSNDKKGSSRRSVLESESVSDIVLKKVMKMTEALNLLKKITTRKKGRLKRR